MIFSKVKGAKEDPGTRESTDHVGWRRAQRAHSEGPQVVQGIPPATSRWNPGKLQKICGKLWKNPWKIMETDDKSVGI